MNHKAAETKGTLLVVDDTPASLELLVDTLTADGYEVLPADGGELALASVAARPPELILLDIRMPGMDGLEVCRRLKARPESRDIPIIFVSASDESAELLEGFKLGAVDFIAKPIQLKELLARVQTHLELRRLRIRSEQQATELRRANERLQSELAERRRSEAAALALGTEIQAAYHASLNLMDDAMEARNRLETANRVLRSEVTERRRVEEELRQSETRYRTVGETIPYGVWLTDPSGGCTYVSDSFRELVGMTLEQIQQFGWLDRLAPENIEPAKAHWLRCVQTGEPFEREHQIRTNDGSSRNVLAIGRPVRDVQGRITAWVGINLDVTEHRRAENELSRLHEELQRHAAELEQRVRERTAELERANKELETFSYSVSHDLRAPLRAMDGFSQALLEECANQLDARGQDYLSRVRAAVARMAGLIDDLLQLSRVTRAELHREPVDLSALARSVADELRQTQPDRTVEVRIADDLTGEGDAPLLRIVLVNLLGNAWKFTGRLSQARIEFGVREIDGAQAFFVRDNGAGFDMAFVGRLFGAFQRLHSTAEFPGTGIGLASIQRIIHRHGGRVWAEGAVGQGATFYFTLKGD